jgi:hypothetical protein
MPTFVKNAANYRQLYNAWDWNITDNANWTTMWQSESLRENFEIFEPYFVSYAVQGGMTPCTGVRYGIPTQCPIKGPVIEPSPLNNRCDDGSVNPTGIW